MGMDIPFVLWISGGQGSSCLSDFYLLCEEETGPQLGGLMGTGVRFIKRRKYAKDVAKGKKGDQKYWDYSHAE